MSSLPRACGLVLALALLPGCSSGTAEPVARDVGHGGVEDLLRVLGEQRVVCADPEALPPDPTSFEQHTRCTLDGEVLQLFHFFSEEQTAAFRGSTTGAGGHGAFGGNWAITTPDRATAERLAALIVAGEAV